MPNISQRRQGASRAAADTLRAGWDASLVTAAHYKRGMRIADCLPRREGNAIVRRLEYADAEAYAIGTKDDAVRRYGHLPLAEYSPQIVKGQIDCEIADGLEDGSLAAQSIADANSDEFLGSTVLFNVGPERAEVGFWLTPQARGRGAAQNGLRAVLRMAAKASLRYLDAQTDGTNLESRRLPEAAGCIQTEGPQEEIVPRGTSRAC